LEQAAGGFQNQRGFIFGSNDGATYSSHTHQASFWLEKRKTQGRWPCVCGLRELLSTRLSAANGEENIAVIIKAGKSEEAGVHGF
jgi:hypothetical protein